MPTGNNNPNVSNSGAESNFKLAKFQVSIKKSRYLKIASIPKFTVKLAVSHLLRLVLFSDNDIRLPATQSTIVDVKVVNMPTRS